MNLKNKKENELTIKLDDTLNLFYDLQNLYAYKEDTRGILKKIYENTLEVLNNPEINLNDLKDENNNNLLHLASDAFNLNFFIKAAQKGINPYEKNNKGRNAFQSRNYDFANMFWKKFEHIYFDSDIKEKSFSHITKGFHPLLKQAIYEQNIKTNSSQYNLKEISDFLKNEGIYSHNNVLSFAFNKFNNSLVDLLDFIVSNENTFTSEDNSLALHCGLKHMIYKNSSLESSYLFDLFIDNADFCINENFLQSMQLSADNYRKSSFQSIFHKQTQILVEKNYNPNKKFDFYFYCHLQYKDKEIHSLNNLKELYKIYSLEPVWNYYKINNNLKIKNHENIKKIKI
jgi:hypothetical protein